MAGRSSIARDPAIQAAVDKAFVDGLTIDEILERLNTDGAGVSRSAIGRYAKRYRPMVEDTIRTKHAIEALRQHIPEGDTSLTDLAQHKLQAQILRTITEREDDDEPMAAKDLATLARALLANKTTERHEVKRQADHEDLIKRRTAAAAEKSMRRNGATPEQIRAVMADITGRRK